jgi:hypothetical protein
VQLVNLDALNAGGVGVAQLGGDYAGGSLFAGHCMSQQVVGSKPYAGGEVSDGAAGVIS